MNDSYDHRQPKHSLLDGEYCSDTTEDYEEEYIPYSLQLLLEQKKNEMKKRYLRNELTDN
ncbi:MAG: hypothetical protein IJO56_07555 [Oscillospiraceae bacterium]|nr:hypothetical protein [Bacteroidaceae bacterium]MBQ9839323.1 hypothetical protein [Oscillospiraceae bacterium]